MPFLTVVVPVYNESQRVWHLREILAYFSGKGFNFEVIVVDDGSTDNTAEEVRRIFKKYPSKLVKIVSYPHNRGKGFAVKTGMLAGKGKYSLFTDIDLSTPVSEWDKLAPFLTSDDVIIGVRRRPGAKILVHQPLIREWLGRGFTKLSQWIAGYPISDFTCGFKCFNREAVDLIFPKLTISGWGFDTQGLYLAVKKGLKIREVPMVWKNDGMTKVKLAKDIFGSLRDLIRVRMTDLRDQKQSGSS